MTVSLVIVVLYLLVTLLIGCFAARRTADAGTFHGRQMGTAAIVFAAAGEWLGGTATTGVSEYGFTYGISGAWYTVANALGVLFLAFFFAGLYRSIGSGTIPGIMAHYFGEKARRVCCLLLVVVMIAVGLSQVIAAGKLGQSLLGLDFTTTATIFSLIFIVFTLSGGMNAISAANGLHLFVMYFGVLLALCLCVSRLGGLSSFQALAAGLDGDYLSPTAIGGTKISSWVIASLLGACTAQAGIQPVLAAKDKHTAKKACLCTALVVAPFGIFTAMLGIVARIFSEQGTLLDSAGNLVTDGKQALSALMLNLPPLAGGLVLASILAAILSTISPIILAAGTMLTKDLYDNGHPNATPRQSLRVSRMFTALSGVIAWGGAIALVNQTTVLDLVYAAYSLRGAIFIVLLFGIFRARRTRTEATPCLASPAEGQAACISMILTAVVAVFWAAWELITGSYPIVPWLTETYAAVLTAVLSMGLFRVLQRK
ncbi:MAG: sodium:solute symporter family protein [Oscillospiraceae bacterium]|nr:sodium:solute symporter family protein [Oscillospiraceae bacterium]